MKFGPGEWETFGRSFFTVLAGSIRAQTYTRNTEHVRAEPQEGLLCLLSCVKSLPLGQLEKRRIEIKDRQFRMYGS